MDDFLNHCPNFFLRPTWLLRYWQHQPRSLIASHPVQSSMHHQRSSELLPLPALDTHSNNQAHVAMDGQSLVLDSKKARAHLGWSDKLSFEESVKWTINWYKNVNEGSNPLEETLKNIKEFESK